MQQPYILYLLHGKTIQGIATVELQPSMHGNLRKPNRIAIAIDLHPKLPHSISDGNGRQTIAGICLYQCKPSASGIEFGYLSEEGRLASKSRSCVIISKISPHHSNGGEMVLGYSSSCPK